MIPLSRLAGGLIYLDTNVVIYIIEGLPTHAAVLVRLLELCNQCAIRLAASELMLAEALVHPIATSDVRLQQAYDNFLQDSPAMRILPLSRAVLVEAARIRVAYRLRLPDAIHMAAAVLGGCDCFLTNDRGFSSAMDVEVAFLADLVP